MATSSTDSLQYACSIIVSVNGVNDANENGFQRHIRSVLPSSSSAIENFQLTKQGKRIYGKVNFSSSVKPSAVKDFSRSLKLSTYKNNTVHAQVDPHSLIPLAVGARVQTGDQEDVEEEEYDGQLNWKDSKLVASNFFTWLHNSEIVRGDDRIDLTSIERDAVSKLFETFFNSQVSEKDKKRRRYLEGLVCAVLRRQKLMRNKRYNDGVVICSFARPDKTLAPLQERLTGRDKLLQQRRDQQADKGGVYIPLKPTTDPNFGDVMPMNLDVSVEFPVTLNAAREPMKLIGIELSGSHKKSFDVRTRAPFLVEDGTILKFSFRSRGTGVYRANINLIFEDAAGKRFSILRNVLLRSGDSDMYDVLKPSAPFVKKKRKKEKPVNDDDVVNPPARGTGFEYKDLKPFKVPLDVRELVENQEMEGALVPPTYQTLDKDFPKVYSMFWQNLLWVSELQAYEDIKLYDMDNVALQRAGRFLKLYVAGLAEGRPSVLRGDIVECMWQGKKYRGRVHAVEMLDVLMEFHKTFHQNFDVRVDRVERVRFTFTRTAFRTAHAGARLAPKAMDKRMLMPQPVHITRIVTNSHQQAQRQIPNRFTWSSQSLNEEQQRAVKEIVKGTLRPMPHIIFGPPGTGKTTTLVEAVYQLARLHISSKNQPKLKILLVAPSNDAADILVEKLATYFPPSEMLRVLAFTRSIDQVPLPVRPYVREGVEPRHLVPEIMNVQIVVSTVNLAARLWCIGEGVSKDHFDVLCVDEAGHATEPEVIGVVATMMKFHGKAPGQLVLAGDPMQLGPIITSELCKKFGMGVSYMERLVKDSPAYQQDEEGIFPPELVTLLVRNYRSHPAILKLPNEMFYDNKLIPTGNILTTHSMVKWEHLPTDQRFPVVFHAVDGENLREGSSPSWFNPQEAMEVVNYVKLLVKHSKPPIGQDDIGIITPYARQVQKIRTALKSQDIGDVKVGSVETFQGQERRCIIISTVRSENELLSHDRKYNLGFVANEKRFNVAVTRAKALLIVVGNPRVLATDKKNWLPFLRYCRDKKSWMGDEWEEESNEDEFVVLDGATENVSDEEDEWQVVAEEGPCGLVINREE